MEYSNHLLNKIENLRTNIIESQQTTAKLYKELIQEIGLKEYSLAEEFLFDAIFNSPDEKDFEYFLRKSLEEVKLNY